MKEGAGADHFALACKGDAAFADQLFEVLDRLEISVDRQSPKSRWQHPDAFVFLQWRRLAVFLSASRSSSLAALGWRTLLNELGCHLFLPNSVIDRPAYFLV
jgi:hypothetical protein